MRVERPELQARPRWPPGFADGDANRRAVLVLASLRGITPAKLMELALLEGSAAACFAAIRSGRAGSRADQRFAREADPGAIASRLAACQARFACPGTEEYVAGLEELRDPPAAVFIRGRSLSGSEPRVAVVGARACSDLGREMAREIGLRLAAVGACVVSGAARGIDSASHEGALEGGGATIAVLGCGIDRAYPPGSRSLIGRIARTGSVVGEYPPGVPAEPFRFPARNRIIAGLAQALVVVEGASGSGSMISAEHALELGRPVYCVPGAVNNPLAEVPHALIRDGAMLIRGPDDLLGDLQLGGTLAGRGRRRHDLSVAEEAVLSHLTGLVLPEKVARAMGLSIPEVVSLLMILEMKGVVRSSGGRYELRLVPTRSG